MLEEKINALKGKIVNFANHVENMIKQSAAGLRDGDAKLLDKVVKDLRKLAGNLELKIEKQCIELIAQHNPMAIDLRTVIMIMKTNADLDRIADHCVNICRRGRYLIKAHIEKELIDNIMEMADAAVRMLGDSVDSFIEEDLDKAMSVCKSDKEMNKMRDEGNDGLIGLLSLNPDKIERFLELIKINDQLERIGDLSTNIAENAFFAGKGKVVKYKKKRN